MATIDETYGATGAMVLRLSLGSMWIAHALLKWYVFTIPGLASWFEGQGLPAFMAWPVFLLELVGGVMILIGFYARYISILLMPILLVATWSHFTNGWVHTNQGGGWEYPMFLLFASMAHALLGDGRFAIHTRKNFLFNKNNYNDAMQS
jgi:putative oxidoreductase